MDIHQNTKNVKIIGRNEEKEKTQLGIYHVIASDPLSVKLGTGAGTGTGDRLGTWIELGLWTLI